MFRPIFTTLMLALPAVFMLFFRPRPGADVDHRRIRRLRAALWIATAACIGAYFGLRALSAAGALDWWKSIPRLFTWSDSPDEIAWVLFFPLWFALAMPLLAAVRPSATSPYPDSARRVAALAPRALARPVRARHWLFGWAIWAAAVVAVAVALASGRDAVLAALLVPLGAMPVALGPLTVRMTLREPEPLDPAGSQDLLDSYARHREAKAWGLFWLQTALTAIASLLPAAVAWQWPLGLAFAIGGSLVGLLGAAFGVHMGVQRMRIRERLDELEGRPQ
jgi:hypothetical protein